MHPHFQTSRVREYDANKGQMICSISFLSCLVWSTSKTDAQLGKGSSKFIRHQWKCPLLNKYDNGIVIYHNMDLKNGPIDRVQAQEFIDETGIDALAVYIGNVHGKYPASGPKLRLDFLKECIKHGVRKFNINTEVRKACGYLIPIMVFED